MDTQAKKQLEMTACKVRMGVIEETFQAKSGHPGGSLSVTDLLTYLYFKEMNIDPAQPKMETRDRFVLSKGHTAPALYAVMAQRGYFPEEELKSLRKVGSRLQGHPSMKLLPGIDMSTGSLGQGISAAVGMALGSKYGHKGFRVYTVLGDGELEEGQVWEAAMFAAAKKLDNLVAIVDNNNLQAAHTCKDNPTAIIAQTIKGKGVSFMENQCAWHGTAPNAEQYELAMNELKAALAELEAE